MNNTEQFAHEKPVERLTFSVQRLTFNFQRLTFNHWGRTGLGLCLAGFLFATMHAADNVAPTEVKSLSINGEMNEKQARLVIQAQLKGPTEDRDKLIFATTLWHSLQARHDQLSHTLNLTLDIIQGEPKEIALAISGEGEIRQVTGEGLLDWSIRQETNAQRFLVLRLKKSDKPPRQFLGRITAKTKLEDLPKSIAPLTLAAPHPSLFNGYVKVEIPSGLDLKLEHPAGLVPIEIQYLPDHLRTNAIAKETELETLAFRFLGSSYSLPLKISMADPETRQIALANFKMTGSLSDTMAAFSITATARVRNPKGGSLDLLSGSVALTGFETASGGLMKFENGRFHLVFDRPGDFPVSLKFKAAVRAADGWNNLDFRVAPSALQAMVLQGLAADTQFRFAGGARPERSNNDFVSYLPANGEVKLAWKQARTEAEGKLFYAAEMLSQVAIGPGLMRQWALFEGKVMQGELTRLELNLRGQGEVTRVQGEQVLSWTIEPAADPTERRLVVQFNQPLKDLFTLQIQLQTPLGAFPLAFDPVQVRPENATRYTGYYRIVNEGAVRLEVVTASGLSQISPEQFPESAVTKALFAAPTGQRFAFRFSGAGYQLRIQADNVLPELAVSELLAYHLGENELVIDAEFELDIREAPLRELQLQVPKGYSIARLNASGLSDYFLKEDATEPEALLRLVYAQPISGRANVELRLERNKALGEPMWTLPRLEITKAKSVRGHVGIAADPGYRLTPATTEGLTEIATAFFPRKLAGIQSAFRLSEPAWRAGMKVERLPQSVQADVVHLFSIGEGIAYGSSIVNYLISGAPISTLKLELSGEYSNFEFSGKDIRNYRKTTNGFEIQLHSPVAGAYTLLATYERSFKNQGETLTFTGARPMDAQSEQGHTIVVSTYQFQVKPVNVSPGLMPLEPGEVPTEYRLFFDAPILAAYRYASRPFNLQLALSPLAQGDTLSQVVDRASLTTRVSKEGQVLTDVLYLIKSRGQPQVRLTLPDDATLWSTTVNGASTVPVIDGSTNVITLPQHTDPNAIIALELKLATRSSNPKRISIAAPMIQAPVLLTEWKMHPDTGQRLVYRQGTLRPASNPPDISGFAGLLRALAKKTNSPMALRLGAAVVLILIAVWVWRKSCQEGIYKFSPRYFAGFGLGLLAAILALVALVDVANELWRAQQQMPTDLAFLAPVQKAGGRLEIQVNNLSAEPGLWDYVRQVWPGVLALGLWIYSLVTAQKWLRPTARVLGWTLLGVMALRWPNGAPAFIGILLAFLLLQVLGPWLIRLLNRPRKPRATPPAPSTTSTAAAAAMLIAGAFLLPGPVFGQTAPSAKPAKPLEPALAQSVIQQIEVKDQYAQSTVKIRWQAVPGQTLPVLYEPAVLTRIEYPTPALKLISTVTQGKRSQILLAQQTGTFDLELQYQLQTSKKDGESGLTLPTPYGLVNEVTLNLLDVDMEVRAPQAVSIERDPQATAKNTRVKLVLSPITEPWLGWKPRSRDTKQEKPVFYAEIFQLYVPSAGVIEGAHQVQIRPAQGELNELVFTVPAGLTITDVLDPVASPVAAEANQTRPPSRVALWRFNPDSRTLRVTLNPPQSRLFTLLVKSQIATGPLPFEQKVGLISITNAAGQIGQLGVATGAEVQLEGVQAGTFSAINIEDFPASLMQRLQNQVPGLVLRRAFRYADAQGTAVLKAAAVEPDVRVESVQTLSLGEDRTLLAIEAGVEITRAGIFRLSFVLPAGLDIESISGPVLSHWTELKTDAGRVITLHLKGKTEGQQAFNLQLTGPGLRATKGWTVPKFSFREASKQQGLMILAPEQGMRLQITTREGVTQLDPQKVTQLDPQKPGNRQKGVLAFRLLHDQWNLALDIEQVEPWIQVTSLQHVNVNEAQIKVAANLQYQIENTGLKSFRVRLPANADSVRFQGEQVSDFLARQGQPEGGLQEWEVKLHRRMIGAYLLQVSYQVLIPEQTRSTEIRGVQALGINLQRGFLTLQSGGRLQVRIPSLPATLQPAEWQSIPRPLQKDLPGQAANFTFRLVEPAYQLNLQLDRHEAAKLLPARVNNFTLTSVISDAGEMLTQVRLDLVAGDKRLLHLKLPAQARFWFAFVNQNGVYPWRNQDEILIPLDQHSKSGQTTAVEFFYGSQVGAARSRQLDLELLGPKLDLPLENIVWRVFLNEKWQLKHWTGSLQLSDDQAVRTPVAIDLNAYLQNEASLMRGKSKEAEELLKLGNNYLQQGDPQQARQAFQTAYGLSQHDDAFNEDARVQLHNLKKRQALLGLNVRQVAVAGDTTAAGGIVRDLRQRKTLAYTQDEANEIIERNAAEDNTALEKLAERLVQQQDAAVANPTAIRASIPEQGRLLTFKRSVAVDMWADLKIGLQATAAKAASFGLKALVLLGTFAFFAVFAWLARGKRASSTVD